MEKVVTKTRLELGKKKVPKSNLERYENSQILLNMNLVHVTGHPRQWVKPDYQKLKLFLLCIAQFLLENK